MIEIAVTGPDEVVALVARIRDRMGEHGPLLDGIGATLVGNIHLGFHDSKSPHGEAWLPLKYRQGKPLLDTGRLRNSIHHTVTGPSDVQVGTDVIYAAIHNFGGQAGRNRKVTIPARPFFPTRNGGVDLPNDWVLDILEVVKAHIEASF